MTFSRRDFIRTAGIAFGAAATLPSWVLDAQAATATYLEVNKNALADAALSTAKRLGASYADIRINRYRLEAINSRERQIQNVPAYCPRQPTKPSKKPANTGISSNLPVHTSAKPGHSLKNGR